MDSLRSTARRTPQTPCERSTGRTSMAAGSGLSLQMLAVTVTLVTLGLGLECRTGDTGEQITGSLLGTSHLELRGSSLLLVYACSACLSLLGSSWVPFRSSWAPHIDWSSCSPFDARSSQKLIPHLHLVVSIWPPCLAAQNERI